jgi:hypothetical protein
MCALQDAMTSAAVEDSDARLPGDALPKAGDNHEGY